MKHLLILSTVFLSLLSIASCGTPTPIGGSDMLTGLMNAQDQATAAAAQYRDVSAHATTIAQATREYLVLQAQQTRIADQSRASQTTFAENLRATQAAGAASATARSSLATSTREAEQANATATTRAANYTATSAAVIVQSTRESASATSTANAANAIATRTSGNATATVIAENVVVEQEKATWNTRLEAGRALASFVVGGIVLIALAIICAMGIVRVIDALVLRGRVFRDPNGFPYIIPESKNGRLMMLAPNNIGGAALQIAQPGQQPLMIEAGAVDRDATRRAQSIGLVRATAEVDGHRAAVKVVEVLAVQEPEPTAPADEQPQISISKPFEPRQLTFENQPSRLALPIGTTDTGSEMWVPLSTVTHALVAGASGMGKTRLLHAWIQSLQRGKVELGVFDGKGGLEFERYAADERTQYVEGRDLVGFLETLLEMADRCNQAMKEVGATNLADYNRGRDTSDRMGHRVVIIDEIAEAVQIDGAQTLLDTVSRTARSSGIHLVSATQHPDAKTISPAILANAVLRVAFSVPHPTNSVAILGCGGADKLGAVPGRMLLYYRGQLTQAQAFQVELPAPVTREIESGDQVKQTPALAAGASVNAPGALTDEVKQMVRYAIEQGGGLFVVTQVVAGLGIRTRDVNNAAMELERQNLLSEVLKDERGQNRGRQISDALRSLV